MATQTDHFEAMVVCGPEANYTPPDHVWLKTIPIAGPTQSAGPTQNAGPTRADLLNVGAAQASGDVLLFLWPNSQLPSNAINALERNLQLLPITIGGNFHITFADSSRYSQWVAGFLKKWRYKGHYYGNSAIFIRKPAFQELNGFTPQPFLEDYDLSQRMEKAGPTVYLPEAVVTKSPQFSNSKVKASVLGLVIHVLYRLGVPPAKLASLW